MQLLKQPRLLTADPQAVLTDAVILNQITSGSRVLDLGCGDGRLLASLRDKRNADIQGIELDLEAIKQCLGRGVPVIQENLDHGLQSFADDSFDFAVLSQTLQQVRQPRRLLQEMLRVAHKALILVPNFGHWKVRLQIITQGRAPVTSSLPYEWFDTPNIHFMSMIDVKDLVRNIDAKIVREIPIVAGRAVEKAWWPNLRAESALYVLEQRPIVPR
ncbi:MAG: methionine biosynthesis protein MetW [Planctomycetaceae bacterium]|nr:methionine biosynthesis protein MetW [Planctomycetaceae bacterium]